MSDTQGSIVPARARDLWVAECHFNPDGYAVFHVDPVAKALETNLRQIIEGRCNNYVPFGICESREEANAACNLMRQMQKRHKARAASLTVRTER